MLSKQFWKVFEHGEGLVGVFLPSKFYCDGYYLQVAAQVYFSHYFMLREVLFMLFNVELKCSYVYVSSF